MVKVYSYIELETKVLKNCKLKDVGISYEHMKEWFKVWVEDSTLSDGLRVGMTRLYLCGFRPQPSEYEKSIYLLCKELTPLFYQHMKERQS